MKTAIYVEDGVVQLVMTPETKFEKNALSTFMDQKLEARIFSGAFYDCRGGWVRQSAHYPQMYSHSDHNKSLIIKTVVAENKVVDDA